MVDESKSKSNIVERMRKYLGFFVEKFREEDTVRSTTFVVIGFPLFFIYIFFKFDTPTATQILISGAVQGIFYMLIAVGFSIIFGIAKMFKLSLGGYFVLGAYIALWLRHHSSMDANFILDAPIDSLSMSINKSLIFLPIVLFIVGLVFLSIKLEYKSYGLILGIFNFIFFLIQRELVVDNFGKVNFQATVHAATIQLGVIVLCLGLYYFELTKRQLLTTFIVVNVLLAYANTFNEIAYSPALYFAILIIATGLVAVASMMIDRYLLDKIRHNPTNVLIVTFGVALLIQSLVPIIKFPDNLEYTQFDINPRNLPGIVPKTENMEIFGVTTQTIRVIATVASLILILLVFIFIKYTNMGLAMRAVAQDPEAASLVGINVKKVYAVVSGLGMGLAAVAGILTTPFSADPNWSPFMGWVPLIFALAVVTLGGLGSIVGSAVAGLIVGYTEVFIATNNIELSSVVPLIVIFIVLLIRPQGLYGQLEEEEE